ncbi:MAG: DUF2784 domain-containing protein [Holophaga sp.]
MGFHWAAVLVLWVHLTFILFVLLGGLPGLRWRWFPLVHLPAAAWGFFVELAGRECPLTGLENRFLVLAGERGYTGGFIEHHLLAVIYPDGLTRGVQIGLALLVAAANLAIYGWIFQRRRWNPQSIK